MAENKNLEISSLESLLLAVGKAISTKEIVQVFEVGKDKVDELVTKLQEKYNHEDSGIHLAVNNDKLQFVTNPKHADFLRSYFQEEVSGELSKPSLETLTIIAYRQPIAKEELEQIRGVNCSMILRNLLIRGLIEAREEKNDLSAKYSVTIDFLRHLGIDSVEALPDFVSLNSDENLEKLLSLSSSEKEESRSKNEKILDKEQE